MKKRELKTEMWVYDRPEDLSPEYQELLQLAHDSVEHAYAPYSKFRVGAAILLDDGTRMGGSNQENASYPITICAERVALSAAASQHPTTAIKAIAVTAKSSKFRISEPISPCGACRQFMCEVESKHRQDFVVILQGEEGVIYLFQSAKDLLPLSFDASFL